MFVKPYLFGALTLLSASSALALTCANDYGSSAGCASNTTAAGDCATLGYSKDNVDGCEHYLYCPFDTSYKRCASFDCAALGFTKEDKSKWCNKIVTCQTDSSYTLCSDGEEAPSCSELGFTKEDKSEWCNNIVACQMDSSYTLCAATENCDDFPLSKCPDGAKCSSCGTGTNLSHRIDYCYDGYDLSADGKSCNASSCSGYTLDECPDYGNCSDCLSGENIKYKLNSCKDGFVQEGDRCRVVTCSDYDGYYARLDGARVCKNKESVKSGTTYITCYSGCASCSSLNVYSFDSVSQACSYFYKQGYRNLCLKNNAVSERGYPYGQCYRYEMQGAASASACRYIWCPDYGY